jgi:hypothetical protein
VAFLTMDLQSRGRPDLAAQVVSSWAEAADDHAALSLLPIYEAYRAIVRGSIAAIRAGQGSAAARAEALRYLDLAGRLTRRRRPALVVTCGVSGSGKSTVAAELVGALPAVRIRSDVERKRLAGMRATDRPGDDEAAAALYGEARTRLVYERLAALADASLAAGASVVIDAACTKRWQRRLLADVARARGVPLVVIAFDLPTAAAMARVEARRAGGEDPSDASADVVRAQVAAMEPIGDDEVAAWRTVVGVPAADAEAGPAAAVARVVRARDDLLSRAER